MTGSHVGRRPSRKVDRVVPVPLPFSGRSVPFAAPIAAAGLMAMTASTKPEIRMSLCNGIGATPSSILSGPAELLGQQPFSPTLRLALWVGHRFF